MTTAHGTAEECLAQLREQVDALPAEQRAALEASLAALETALALQPTRGDMAQYTERLEQRVARRAAALHISEARFRSIFENAGIGIALLDIEGRILAANPALQGLLASDGGTVEGQPWISYVHPEDVAAYTSVRATRGAISPKDSRRDIRLIGPEQQEIWTDLTCSVVRDEAQPSQYRIVMVKNISQQRQAQEAMIQTEKLALTGRLAASLAHEINNPLQTVIGCLGLAEETLEENGDTREFLKLGLDELKRAARIVAQLRDLNRRAKPEERQPFDVVALVRRLTRLIYKKCRDRQVTLTWETEAEIPEIKGVVDRIQQVFLNLALNALDAMPNGGTLHISVTRTAQPAGIRVAFADTGIGMPADTQEQLFDAFYTTKSRGLGLGLFSSCHIIEDHGGQIDVESQVGEGTTFTVWLPT